MVSHPLRMRKALGSNPSVSIDIAAVSSASDLERLVSPQKQRYSRPKGSLLLARCSLLPIYWFACYRLFMFLGVTIACLRDVGLSCWWLAQLCNKCVCIVQPVLVV